MSEDLVPISVFGEELKAGVPEGSQRGPLRVEQTPPVFLCLWVCCQGTEALDCAGLSLELVQYYIWPLGVSELQASWFKPQVKAQL